MTDPLPAALARASQAAGEGLLAAVERRPAGSPVRATVLALTRQGPLIEAAGHRWLVSGAPPLARGAALTLDHLAARPQPHAARLLAIDARTLSAPLAVRLQPAAAPAAAAPPASSVPHSSGAVQVEARLIGPAGRALGPVVTLSLSAAAASSPPANAAPPPPPGSAPVGPAPAPPPAAVAAGFPAAGPSPSATALPAPPPTAAASPPVAAAPAPSSAAAPPVPAVAAAPSSTTAPAPLAAGATLPAAVADRDARGRLLLQSGDLRLRVETPLDLPLGARLTLVLPQGLPPLSEAPPAPAADPVQRLITALLQRERDPSAAQPGAGLRLPAADHALGARLLRWVQTLAGAAPTAGDNDGAAELERTGEPLRTATLELMRQAREPQPGGWRVLMMPLGVEEPQILKLHLRQPVLDPEREARAPRDHDGTVERAIFEVEFSRLGRCQLDVLCQGERFDLVVRSAGPLGAAVEDEIRGLMAATRAAAGLSGRLEFRAAELLRLPDPSLPAGRQITV
jgi:hypothetical protein